jgi:arylsulfatase A-like enzyme
MPEPVVGDWESILEPYRDDALHESHVAVYPRKVIDRAKAGYYGHITHIDHQINRVLEHLRQYGQHENTWVCFVSDHGEMMGDHHLYRKGYPYEASSGVPLILSGPPDSGIPTGTTCDAVVELRDILPTLLDCAGIAAPDGIDGISLLPLVRGERETVRDWLHGEHTLFGQSVQWLTDGHWKYAWWSGNGQQQLFDLDSDPEERHDLAALPEWEQTVTQWRSRLIAVLDGREDGLSDGSTLRTGRSVRPVLPAVLEAWTGVGRQQA